jgi:DNA adenine methylase
VPPLVHRPYVRPSPPLKWHGGKHYLADWVVSLMPAHTHYVEPYAGGLSVLLAKNPEGVSEVANDLDNGLTNLWTVLQGRWFDDFVRIVSAIPFSESEFRHSTHPDAFYGHNEAGVNQAIAFFVRCRQSLAGRMKSFTSVTKTRTRRGMNNEVSAWLTAVEGLPEVHARLKRVLILNRPALEVIKSQDGPKTLFYLDPPYYPDTRADAKVYEHEMSVRDHWGLLGTLSQIKGKFLLSGYMNATYHTAELSYKWKCHEKEIPNHAAGGSSKRRMTECIWTNF